MSHFNGDKDGHLSDPTQKTLANFIISGDASGKNVCEHSLLGSDTSDSHFMVNPENDLSIDNHETCHYVSEDLLDSNLLSDLDHCNFNLSNNSGKIDNNNELPLNGSVAKVYMNFKDWFIILTSVAKNQNDKHHISCQHNFFIFGYWKKFLVFLGLSSTQQVF